MIRWRWLGVALVVAMVAAGVWWRGGHRRHHESAYRTVTVERGDLQVTILATGEVQPDNRLEIKAPIAGRVEAVLVEEGEAVTKGQVVAWLSSTERAALLDAARAQGPDELAHWEALYKPAPLMAPLDGAIIARNVEPGQTIATSDAVLVLSDRLIVKASVDETDIGQVRLNEPASITLDAYPNDAVAGTVTHIAYEAKTVNNVTTYEVDVLPARVPEFMRSGMTANVTFLVAEQKDLVLLPAEAVKQEDNGASVLVPDPSGRTPAIRRPVETGLSDGKRLEVVSGVQAGDTVLVPVFKAPRSGQGQTNPFSPMRGQRRAGGSRGS